MKSFRRWSRDRRNPDRDGNTYSQARYEAHRDGIKIVDRRAKNLMGYALGAGCVANDIGEIESYYIARIMYFSPDHRTWFDYDEKFSAPTKKEVREKATEYINK